MPRPFSRHVTRSKSKRPVCGDPEGRGVRGHSPFDGALQVGLADRAVVEEYCRAGAELFRQNPRGHLVEGERRQRRG